MGLTHYIFISLVVVASQGAGTEPAASGSVSIASAEKFARLVFPKLVDIGLNPDNIFPDITFDYYGDTVYIRHLHVDQIIDFDNVEFRLFFSDSSKIEFAIVGVNG